MKTAFGRANASVRAGRGMTGADWAAETGIGSRQLYNVEAGKSPVTIEFVAALVEPCNLTVDERCRLAAGWGTAGAEGHPVRYEVRPGSEAGHRSAAMIASFASDSDDADWDLIRIIITDRVCGKAVAA